MKKILIISLNISLVIGLFLDVQYCYLFSDIKESCGYWPFSLVILIPFVFLPLNVLAFSISNYYIKFIEKYLNNKFVIVSIFIICNWLLGCLTYIAGALLLQ